MYFGFQAALRKPVKVSDSRQPSRKKRKKERKTEVEEIRINELQSLLASQGETERGNAGAEHGEPALEGS